MGILGLVQSSLAHEIVPYGPEYEACVVLKIALKKLIFQYMIDAIANIF